MPDGFEINNYDLGVPDPEPDEDTAYTLECERVEAYRQWDKNHRWQEANDLAEFRRQLLQATRANMPLWFRYACLTAEVTGVWLIVLLLVLR